MKQVVLIHGGTTFSNYDKYMDYLSNKPLKIERFFYSPTWRERLQEVLGNNYQVLTPTMPNKTNAKYSEWSAWFRHISDLFIDEVILIGHSLGGIFLAKYLSENNLRVKINKLILVAAPYEDESIEDLADFKITKLSNRLSSQVDKIILIQGSDDPVVSMSDFNKYKTALPNAKSVILSAPDHFLRSDFPELIEIINEKN